LLVGVSALLVSTILVARLERKASSVSMAFLALPLALAIQPQKHAKLRGQALAVLAVTATWIAVPILCAVRRAKSAELLPIMATLAIPPVATLTLGPSAIHVPIHALLQPEINNLILMLSMPIGAASMRLVVSRKHKEIQHLIVLTRIIMILSTLLIRIPFLSPQVLARL
jgi:hypothetical protein